MSPAVLPVKTVVPVAGTEGLGGRPDLAGVPAAAPLFEEPGTLDEVARLALGWFRLHLRG